MMRGRVCLLCLLCATLTLTPQVQSTGAPRPRSALAGIKELDKTVTYTETKIPLGEMVTKVASDTGFALTAAKEVADEPVAVVVKDLPARELMEQLAELLDYRWGRRAGGRAREIYQDLAGRQREEALRHALAAEPVFRALKPALRAPGERIVPWDGRGDEGRVEGAEKEMQEQWAGATGYRVNIRLDLSRLHTEGTVSVLAAAVPLRGDEQVRLRAMGRATSVIISAPRPDPRSEQLSELTPQRRAALEQDPVFGARKQFKPEAKPRVNPLYNGRDLGGLWYLHDLLPDLARVYGVQFISDAYWNAPLITGSASTREPTALFAMLDRFAESGYLWEQHGKLVRVRDRRWFLDRPREVPLRFVRQWGELYDRHGALPFDTYLEMATTLTDSQLEALLPLVQAGVLPPGRYDLQRVSFSRHALRLYASLTLPQRQALWGGGSIPVSRLTAAQQALLASHLKEGGRGPIFIGIMNPVPAMKPADLAGASFSLAVQPSIRPREPLPVPATQGRSPPGARPPQPGLAAPTTGPANPEGYPVSSIRFLLKSGSATQLLLGIITVSRPR